MNTEGLNAFGAIAEVIVVMYRSAINAGATKEDAKDIVEAYFAATIKNGNTRRREYNNGKDKD